MSCNLKTNIRHDCVRIKSILWLLESSCLIYIKRLRSTIIVLTTKLDFKASNDYFPSVSIAYQNLLCAPSRLLERSPKNILKAWNAEAYMTGLSPSHSRAVHVFLPASKDFRAWEGKQPVCEQYSVREKSSRAVSQRFLTERLNT